MSPRLLPLFIVITILPCLGAEKAAVRTFKNLRNFPVESLRKGITKKLYRSLEISPVSAHVVARAPIINGETKGAKIIHSEANGAYDQMLLEMANSYRVTGQNTVESRLQQDSLMVHLLIYDIKDGKMAVCVSHSDDARYTGYHQYGIAWVGIHQGGQWTTISGDAPTKWGGSTRYR